MNHQIKALELVPKVMAISIGNSKNMRAFVDNEGGIWFCLRDVLEAMGSSTPPSVAKRSVIDIFGEGVIQVNPLQTAGGMQNVAFAHESATTYLIANGNTETSKNLNRKIHAEILPELRKTGRYEVVPQTREQRLAQAVLDSVQIIEEEREARKLVEQKLLEESTRHKSTALKLKHSKIILDTQKPKVDFANRVVKSSELFSLTDGLRMLGVIKTNKMIAVLRSGVVNSEFNSDFKWLESESPSRPMQKARANGWVELKVVEDALGKPRQQTCMTMAGVFKLRQLLEEFGVPIEVL